MFNSPLDVVLISLLVRLSPRAVHRGAFAPVEHSELDTGGVNRFPHQAAQSIDLAHDLAFGHATNGRIARHLSDGIEIGGQQSGLGSDASRRGSGFRSGVSCANHDHVVLIAVTHWVVRRKGPVRGNGDAGGFARTRGPIRSLEVSNVSRKTVKTSKPSTWESVSIPVPDEEFDSEARPTQCDWSPKRVCLWLRS